MRKIFKSLISIVLIVALIVTSNVSVIAAAQEEYLCELRLIYADSYNEAVSILYASEFKDYKLFKDNLNKDPDEIGVWLAYKTTTDIEDAITDISIMQMDGGYNENNYQQMINESYLEYLKLGENYLKAIEYFSKAYDAGHYLAKSAYRQLNFYYIETQKDLGIKIPSFEGEKLGDVFRSNIDEGDLATIFMEGNKYVLNNVRSLLAMGVSYNEDGKTYLQKVTEAADLMNENPDIFSGKQTYDELAALIASTITTLRDMFKEFAAYEPELNYEDDEISDEEYEYIEHKALAEMTRNTKYLGGKTLYQFCVDFVLDENDYSNLYPLVAALNEGQTAMTKVLHYYNVIRYSISDYPEDVMDEEIAKLEETYSDNPFNVYTGVDRSIYNGTFALTSEAYRANAYTEEDYFDEFFGEDQIKFSAFNIAVGTVGGTLLTWAIVRHVKEYSAYKAAYFKAYAQEIVARSRSAYFVNKIAGHNIIPSGTPISATIGSKTFTCTNYESLLDGIIASTKLKYSLTAKYTLTSKPSFADKYFLVTDAVKAKTITLNKGTLKPIKDMMKKVNDDTYGWLQTGQEGSETAAKAAASKISGATIALYVISGLLLLYSGLSIGYTVYSYYNPELDDIPIAMVDLINTEDGDRYIKYDVVYNAELEENIYRAGDLNAYEGERWNALYYTKSYEAGKPLLADTFKVSYTSNTPAKNYVPVHHFGEVNCYNLNKHNFDGDTSIFLSVKQSQNNKAAVADVPNVVGSIFSNGLWALVGGFGVALGVFGTLGTQKLLKKKRIENTNES